MSKCLPLLFATARVLFLLSMNNEQWLAMTWMKIETLPTVAFCFFLFWSLDNSQKKKTAFVLHVYCLARCNKRNIFKSSQVVKFYYWQFSCSGKIEPFFFLILHMSTKYNSFEIVQVKNVKNLPISIQKLLILDGNRFVQSNAQTQIKLI